MAKPAFNVRKLQAEAFDTRVQDRHVTRGRVTRSELDSHIAGLSDDAAEGEYITVTLGDSPDEDAPEA